MIMSRLKTAMEEIKVLNKTVATLTQKLQQWEEKLIQLKSARIATIPIGNCMTNGVTNSFRNCARAARTVTMRKSRRRRRVDGGRGQ
jgi:hypothetical protein